jgi:iron complex outermembrane receptor protein
MAAMQAFDLFASSRRPAVPLALAFLCAGAWAQSDATLGAVEVRADRDNASREREESTASKIVIGREELEQQGDATVGEVLKRQPGVTIMGAPGRGGAIRMRGLGGGYTQILLDGERVPPGFDVTSLPPAQVQRIEIMRAPTAETGAQAIAGTINIVLREGRKGTPDELKLSHSQEHGQGSQQLQWVHQLPGGPMPGSITVSASTGERADETQTHTVSDVSGGRTERWRQDVSSGQRHGLHVNGRFQWKGEGGKSLTLMPFVVYSEFSGLGRSDVTQSGLSETAQQTRGGHFAMARLNSVWSQRLSADDKLELRAGLGQSRYAYQMNQFGGASFLPNLSQSQDFLDQSGSLSGKWTRALDSGHVWVSGLEYEQVHRNERGNAAVVTEGGNLSAQTQRWAVYSQDEFSINRQWSAYGGLRYESLLTQGQEGATASRNRSGVWTPLLHAVFKPDPDKRDQVRMSLTRSYKAPSMYNLIGLYQQSTGENSATNPDRSGNPNLRPELATGVDLTYERYLAQGGVLSATVFRRHIQDLIRYSVNLEGGRYVAAPANAGQAITQGLELEAKFRLDQWVPQALPVDIRSNVSFFHSKVDSVPGPDNRLDRQPDMTANLGADYRMRGWPLTVGGSLNLNPAYSTQVSAQQSAWLGAKRVLDVYGLWRINDRTGLRLTLSNALGRDYVYSSAYSNATSGVYETATSTSPSWRSVQLRLEMKL